MRTDIILHNPKTEFFGHPQVSVQLSVNQMDSIDDAIQLPEILFVTSFPPRECGIATFSQDLIAALKDQFEHSFNCSICALESEAEQHVYPIQPRFILNTSQRNAFVKTAFLINHSDNIDLVVIQHEFGFFADKELDFKLFFENILKPIVFVFHTVLPSPGRELLDKIQDMAAISASIVVMTNDAAKILIDDYNIAAYKISVIPHGTHLVLPLNKSTLKKKYNLTGFKVLSTFGLLGSSKSIETTLMALPEILLHHPNVLFLVLGKTHPAIVKKDGEKYRHYLESLVLSLKLENNVRFVNEYLSLPNLLEYLQLTDIYLFTSKDPNQAVSGTFSYAISSGCPVISTPIPHAKEVFRDGGGVIIGFEDSLNLADEAIALLDDEFRRNEISLNSFHKMASTVWQNSAISYGLLFDKLITSDFHLNFRIPVFNLNHIRRMTTDLGMIQFAKLSIPDYNSGFTLDDNARALISIAQHYELFHTENDLVLVKTYLNFIARCMQPNGIFLNYVDTNKEFTQQNYSENLEDCNGRAIWALGYLYSLKNILPDSLLNLSIDLVKKALPQLLKIHSTRAMAFIIKGLHYVDSQDCQIVLEELAKRMALMYKHEKNNQWFWFERYMTYANGLLPEAMLCAYTTTYDEEYRIIALESFDFLLSIILSEDKIKVISNKGWLMKDSFNHLQIGGEQPIDVAYTILALERFYTVFKKDIYKQKMKIAFNWFLGANHLNQIVYNPRTGGCYDGLEETHVNLNQGAESSISYLLSRLAICRILESDKGNYIYAIPSSVLIIDDIEIS
jgi:glycosyltransferase involved in cell wall biosynthesis